MASSARYLIRLVNDSRYSPADVSTISTRIRKILESSEAASHFRIGTHAIEFNLFARTDDEIDKRKRLLEENGFKILTEKILDIPPPPSLSKSEALRDGVRFFNEERFWESHEVLEQVWREATGPERDVLQGIILTAAAYVHFQKGEQPIFFSILKRARAKILETSEIEGLDIDQLKTNIDRILESRHIRLFKLKSIRF